MSDENSPISFTPAGMSPQQFADFIASASTEQRRYADALFWGTRPTGGPSLLCTPEQTMPQEPTPHERSPQQMTPQQTTPQDTPVAHSLEYSRDHTIESRLSRRGA